MKLKHYILFALLIGLFTTCKKFPEDPFISLNTVKDRLKGTWTVISIIHDDSEIINQYNDTIQPFFIKDITFNFSFDRKSNINGNNVNDLNIESGRFGLLYFTISKKKISFQNNASGKLNNLFLLENNFDIRKLFKNTFKIRNSNFEIIFKKN